ncbi:MAG: hypothetical protein KF819_06480 [Labilithrix sp.]|nr:hypothetical protein [Labilithrix sp.]
MIEPRGEGARLKWVCGVCGGPRTPGGLGGEAALAPLREAKAHGGRATRARAASWLFIVMATFMTLVAAAAWPAALTAKILLLALALTPALLAARARARASKADAASEAAMEGAWLAAAEDFATRAKKGVTPAELAKALKIDEARADRLLTELAASDRTRVDVDDDEVRFSVRPSPAKIRIPSEPLEEEGEPLEEVEGSPSRARGTTR